MNRDSYRRLFETRLYSSPSGCCLALAPGCELLPPESLTLQDAVASTEYRVTFLFTENAHPIISREDALILLDQIAQALGETRRGVVWLGAHSTAVLPLTDEADALCAAFLPEITERLSLILPTRTRVEFSEENSSLRLEQCGDPFRLSTEGYACAFSNAVLTLCGENAGFLSFGMQVTYDDFVRCFPTGFEYSWQGAQRPLTFPLLEPYSESPILPMRFRLDFSVRARSSVLFSLEGIMLASGFRTIYGERVLLETTAQGGFCFPGTPVQNSRLIMAPMGTYRIRTQGNDPIKLLCGLSGTEFFQLAQSAEITFVPEQPAFTDGYPAKELSIEDFVNPPPRLPLSAAAVTSWFVPHGGRYVSQPSEAPYYGGKQAILLHTQTATELPLSAPSVPLVPYGALERAQPDTACFEAQVLARCRAELMEECPAPRRVLHGDGGSGTATIASPSGYLVETQGERWTKLQLAVSEGGELAFCDPCAALAAAFSSAGLFLVAAQEGVIPQNTVSMDGWRFKLSVGAGCKYNDYRNILLVKSLPGKLYDPDDPDRSLVCAMSRWTQRGQFASPCGDAGQQSNLACCLTDYFAKAYAQRGSPYFSGIAHALTDESWQGFLFLNVTLAPESFPPELRSLLPREEGDISLHHLGARVTPLKPGPSGPSADGISSLFGLIFYQADGFAGAVLPPDAEQGFAYRSNEIKVLFQNSAVARFESTAQLTMGDFMGVIPTTGGCPYNTILLKGAYQAEDGEPSYTLSSLGENLLLFTGKPFARAVLNKVTLSGSETENTFSLSGCIAFSQMEGDIWSYESLVFAGMELIESSSRFRCELAALTFDLQHSILRQGSFAQIFALMPEEILCGDQNAAPQKKGYAPIASEWLRNATFPGSWCGLRLRAVLGTTGELAGNGGIGASVLLAWDGDGKTFAGIALPGAVMIENVLGLSVGTASLIRQDGRLMLMLSDVALKCLGFLKLPPGGSLSMSMFQGTGWFAMYKKEK